MASWNVTTLVRRVSLVVASAVLATPAVADLPKYQMKDLGTLGGTYSIAFAINDAGQVTGLAGTADGGNHAFIASAMEPMKDLGTLGDYSIGRSINTAGQVRGYSASADVKPVRSSQA